MSEIFVCAAAASRRPVSVTRHVPRSRLRARGAPGAICKDSPSPGQGQSFGRPRRESDPARTGRDAEHMAHRVTLIPGDGIGPEVVDAARRAIEATGVPIEWDLRHMGAGAFARTGESLPQETLASIRSNRAALKGPIETPVTSGLRSVNLTLRRELD